METLQKVSHIGCDLHKKFTIATARDARNRRLWRQRLEHRDRPKLQAQLDAWPEGTPVIFEASFGWGWFADALQAAALVPHLASSRKVAAWRDARGLPKSNRVDAELLSELWGQQPSAAADGKSGWRRRRCGRSAKGCATAWRWCGSRPA